MAKERIISPDPSADPLMCDQPEAGSSGQTLLHVGTVLLRRRRWVFGIPFLLATAVVGIGLVLPRQYSASASFAPQAGPGALSRLSGIAAQFGLSVPTDDAAQSPEFYADLLRSPQLLRELVAGRYRIIEASRDTIQMDLIEVYGIAERTPGRDREKAVERLAQDIMVSTDLKTGVVGFAVTARYPELAHAIVERVLDLVNRFNLETRQSQAAAERRFAESRLAAVESELRETEDRLQSFLQRNRDFRNSPQLTFAHDRLQREVQLRQELFGSLSQAYEQSRIEEVRNTPVITVIERPIVPVRPDGRRLALKAIVAVVVGFLFAVLAATGHDMLRRQGAAEPATSAEFRRLLGEARADLRHPRRLFSGHRG